MRGQAWEFRWRGRDFPDLPGDQLSKIPAFLHLFAPAGFVQPATVSEEVLWKGSPSQVLNLGKYLIALLLAAGIAIGGLFFMPAWAALILPLGWALWIFVETRSIQHELTTERIRLSSGVFNQTKDDVELYRVKDTSMERPFWYRVFGLSTLIIETSDRSQPRIEIKAVHNGEELRETLRRQVEFWRDRKRVREVDFDEGGLADGDAGFDDETMA
jgi:uncharacterized membrane protein YdbT with pleckstrin-like domain